MRLLVAMILLCAGGVSARPMTPAEDTETSNPLKLAAKALDVDFRDLEPDPFRTMLGAVRNDAPPLAIRALAEPLRAPYQLGMLEETLRDEAISPHRLCIAVAGLAGVGIARGYVGNPLRGADAVLVAADDPLPLALAELAKSCDAPFDTAALPDAAALPEPLRSQITRIVFAFASAERMRREALRPLALPSPDATMREVLGLARGDLGKDYRVAAKNADLALLVAGSLDLVMAIEDFTAWLHDPTTVLPADAACDIRTPLGRFVVDTRDEDSTHTATLESPLAFIFDAHGNDRYVDDSGTAGAAPICVIVDGDGNDAYAGTRSGGFARGLLGYGIVWDLAGNDRYQGALATSAAAIFGAALLVDEGTGSDTYETGMAAQGYAFAGIAVLIDQGGDDRYDSLTRAQGSGAPRGAALLLDLGGDDGYTLGDDPLVSPAAQMPDRNSSAGQGCGIGIRAELSDGRTLPGGVGILIDAAGNDRYRASVYAQGAGYLEGIGFLCDNGGNDVYEGGYYVQGAAAHRAVGALLDRGGDDSYACEVSASLAAAVDSSTAVFVDEAGNDRYRSAGQALGSSFENGVSLFVDSAGDDTYAITDGSVFGVSEIHHWGSSREASLGLGLFFDLGGEDTYPSSTRAKNDGVWRGMNRYPELELRSEYGAGVDGEFASPFFTRARTPRNESSRQLREETWKERRAWEDKIHH